MSQILQKAEDAIGGHKHATKDHDNDAEKGGSRGSKLANKLDPRTHAKHDHRESETPISAIPDNSESRTAEDLGASHTEDTVMNGTVGAHHDDSDVNKEVEQHAVPEDEHDKSQEAKLWRPIKQDRLVGY
ncbi:hypothetical protein N7456_006583 [Penicillium angulare]|uniref:Uncharacterized protein n=1 Tax=Penicillium angulare TaxID=116970 RepID=A0A9W9KCC2_9EURO|nr:hypothetical protein N7456_006583 [Penicillium angulare]